ncbi:unnamed protein product [Gongylonema pulchrum]|nr:unnamed protein product [Gongylonema pulchrum]
MKNGLDVKDFNVPETYLKYAKYRTEKLWSDTKRIYANGFIRKWSLWWAMTTCMSLQVSLNFPMRDDLLKNCFCIFPEGFV